jgi:excisionase family DNA binding protein
MASEFLTTKQAAAMLDVSPQRVRVLIRSGRLKAKMIGEGNRATYLILREDLEAVRHRKPGRPHKRKSTTSLSNSAEPNTGTGGNNAGHNQT